MSRIKDESRTLDDLQKLPIIGKHPKNEKEEKFLREVCEFEFFNLEEPGVSCRFPYGNAKHQHNFTLFHGGKYKLPRFIAAHLESKCTPIWEWRPDGTGRLVKKQIGNKPRFQMRQVFGG
jgi:hypothetical protein